MRIVPFCLVLLFVLISIVLLLRKRTEYYPSSSSCIITMTTYMGFEDRFQNMDKILGPLVATGQEVVVINEWDENYHVYSEFMRTHYPQVHFVQKSMEDRGQPRSLNILVRDYLLHSGKKYWVHWEDTWVATRPFLPDLVHMMDRHPDVVQLQATDDWKDMPPQHTLHRGDISVLIPQYVYDRDIYDMGDVVSLETWPLFSLRPSINRLSFFQRHARDFYFKEDIQLWPLLFEWEFGRIFLRNGGVKAITKRPYAQRIKGSRSTYAYLLTCGGHSRGEKCPGGC